MADYDVHVKSAGQHSPLRVTCDRWRPFSTHMSDPPHGFSFVWDNEEREAELYVPADELVAIVRVDKPVVTSVVNGAGTVTELNT